MSKNIDRRVEKTSIHPLQSSNACGHNVFTDRDSKVTHGKAWGPPVHGSPNSKYSEKFPFNCYRFQGQERRTAH